MKDLIFINGAAGTGKSTTCKILLKMLPKSVYLDGDWCFYTDPWKATDETVTMAMKNMAYLLDSFLSCSVYENIVFGWVLHKEGMTENILSMLKNTEYKLHKFSLLVSESNLLQRLQKDMDSGARENKTWEHSLMTRPWYEKMDTIKIDTDHMTAEQAADRIYSIINPAY